MAYKQETTTETGWTDWLRPSDLDDYRIACCDCGLVHRFQLRPAVIVPQGKEFAYHELVADLNPGEHVSVILRAQRDNRATGQIRRRRREAA